MSDMSLEARKQWEIYAIKKIKEGSFWNVKFYDKLLANPIIEVLEIKDGIVGFTDNKKIYFEGFYTFISAFELVGETK